MPGTELFGAEERKEIEDVLSIRILFRYNHDALRNNIWQFSTKLVSRFPAN